jgi:hypothetical protein
MPEKSTEKGAKEKEKGLEVQKDMALGFALHTVDMLKPTSEDREGQMDHYKKYVNQYAVITFSNDHERSVGGRVVNVKYDEFFEQPTFELKLTYGNKSTLEIPRSSILHLERNFKNETEMNKRIDQLIKSEWAENRSPLHFTYIGNLHVLCEIIILLSEIDLLGGYIIPMTLVGAAEELRKDSRSPIVFTEFMNEVGDLLVRVGDSLKTEEKRTYVRKHLVLTNLVTDYAYILISSRQSYLGLKTPRF